MANVLLSWSDMVSAAATVLTASDEAGSMSVSNIAAPIIGKRWRSTNLGAWGQADFGGDRTIDVVALAFSRDTMGALAGSIRHRFDADGGVAGSGAAHDSGSIPLGVSEGYGYHIYLPPAGLQARTWRWTYDAEGVGYIDTGRAWAGEAWRPGVNMEYGVEDGWRDLSRISQSTRSGAEFVDERPRQRRTAFALGFLTDAEKLVVREMQRIAGMSRQVLAVLDTDATAAGEEAIIGRMEESTPIRHANFDIHSKPFSIRESL